jgi:ABC-type uncharacterized transport system auxiliary subunit
MRTLIFIISLVLLCLVLIHCGGVPQTYYYRINYSVDKSQSNETTLPVTLGIGRFDADILYESDKIVYRDSEFEAKFYNYRRWIAPPKKLITEKVTKEFQNSGSFEKVLKMSDVRDVDYYVAGQILAFEEWDEKETWYGLVTIEFELRNAADADILWNKVITEKTRSANKAPVDVVAAINKSLDKVIAAAISEVLQSLKSRGV